MYIGEGGVCCHVVILMQHWRKLDQHKGEPCPVGRVRHAAVCLGDQPQVFITGGYDNHNILNDGWILDVQSGRWREVSSLLTCCIVLCDAVHTLVWVYPQPLCKGHSYWYSENYSSV